VPPVLALFLVVFRLDEVERPPDYRKKRSRQDQRVVRLAAPSELAYRTQASVSSTISRIASTTAKSRMSEGVGPGRSFKVASQPRG
jgi:hypothetical protein